MEVKMKNKNTKIEAETSLIELPKMEFVFDSGKITPAKIDKDMIDFEKAEKEVEEIEKLYDVVFDDVATVKKYREEVASKKANADKFKKDLMDFLTSDTKEVNQKLINLIKRVEAVRKFLHEKEKELDNVKREKIKSIKELIFKDRPDYLIYLTDNEKWEKKTFKETNIEAEIQQQYDELIKKENFIKQEIEKANKEIQFKILFENVKFLIKKEYATISEAITNKMNEIKQTEENLRKQWHLDYVPQLCPLLCLPLLLSLCSVLMRQVHGSRLSRLWMGASLSFLKSLKTMHIFQKIPFYPLF